jgi:hypothetical protein
LVFGVFTENVLGLNQSHNIAESLFIYLKTLGALPAPQIVVSAAKTTVLECMMDDGK